MSCGHLHTSKLLSQLAFLVKLGIIAQKSVAITAIKIIGLVKLVLKANKSTDKIGDNIKITMMGSVRIAKDKKNRLLTLPSACRSYSELLPMFPQLRG